MHLGIINIFDISQKIYSEFDLVEKFKSQSRIKIFFLYYDFLWKSIMDTNTEINKIVLRDKPSKFQCMYEETSKIFIPRTFNRVKFLKQS